MKIVYFFCCDPTKDKVAPAVFNACCDLLKPMPTGIQIDGLEALEFTDEDGNLFVFVPTREVLSHEYERYLPSLNEHFADFDLAGIVNWHEGGNAPDPIFCAHTNGDVPSGTYPTANPVLTTAILHAVEDGRKSAGLEGWSVLPEATHFSGVQYGVLPSSLLECDVPVIDVEIGSSSDSWSNLIAIGVLAQSLIKVCQFINPRRASVLFVGGMHFEPSLQAAVMNTDDNFQFAFSHVLPNQWVTSGVYQGEAGIKKLRSALESVIGGVQILVFHEGLKGPFKEVVRALGAELGIPVVKHKRLRDGLASLRG